LAGPCASATDTQDAVFPAALMAHMTSEFAACL